MPERYLLLPRLAGAEPSEPITLKAAVLPEDYEAVRSGRVVILRLSDLLTLTVKPDGKVAWVERHPSLYESRVGRFEVSATLRTFASRGSPRARLAEAHQEALLRAVSTVEGRGELATTGSVRQAYTQAVPPQGGVHLSGRSVLVHLVNLSLDGKLVREQMQLAKGRTTVWRTVKSP